MNGRGDIIAMQTAYGGNEVNSVMTLLHVLEDICLVDDMQKVNYDF